MIAKRYLSSLLHIYILLKKNIAFTADARQQTHTCHVAFTFTKCVTLPSQYSKIYCNIYLTISLQHITKIRSLNDTNVCTYKQHEFRAVATGQIVHKFTKNGHRSSVKPPLALPDSAPIIYPRPKKSKRNPDFTDKASWIPTYL